MSETINVPRELLNISALHLEYSGYTETGKKLRTLLQAPSQPAQVQGWQMVPVEPTWNMLDCIMDWQKIGNVTAYRAMLAAAPKPPVREPVEWDGKSLPYDWVAVRMEFDGPDHPEDYAYGPPRMMDRLRGILERYYEQRFAAAPKPPVQEHPVDQIACHRRVCHACAGRERRYSCPVCDDQSSPQPSDGVAKDAGEKK